MSSAGPESTVSNPLPAWDLGDLYTSPEAPELAADLERTEREARAFHERLHGRVQIVDGRELGLALAEYERLDEVLSRIISYAQLLHAGAVDDPRIGQFYQTMQEKVTDISVHLLFFALEINKIDDATLAQRLEAPELARYAAWIHQQRLFRPHQLSDEVERLLHEKSVAGRSAWTRLYDETLAALRFGHEGKDLTLTEALDRLYSKDPAERQTIARTIGGVLDGNRRLMALTTNTLAKDKEIEDKWRGYARPSSQRNLSNQVEDEVVDALVAAVTASYPKLSHRYYALKARWMGMEKLAYWDRNAPLPEDADSRIEWPEAQRLVLDAYHAFSPELAAVGRQFFEKPWIDAAPRPGKASGAFAHSTVPSVHPYLLVNYLGRARDVMTLAHELGHGCHQVLAGPQGHFLSSTPLTLAETASVFGEMLTFRAMLDAETDPVRRRVMIAGKVEDMINTVVRQIAFYTFEQRVHDERRSGELTAERIGEIWLEIQKESLGPAFTFDDSYRGYWSYIPHFIHSPFYVYAYAFGDCLVNSLYDLYRSGAPDFQRKYLDMLRAGGTLHHKELLAPFGLDASDPAFWLRGIGVVAGLIDELEEMI